MKTHIVIPLGVAAPGTPDMNLLAKSIYALYAQSSQDYEITVAADNNIPDGVVDFLNHEKIDISWFPDHSFFAPGGIWKKISQTWAKKDSEYIAFLHYDDLWAAGKLQAQVNAMDVEGLDGSWSRVHYMDYDGNVRSGDVSPGQLHMGTIQMKTPAFAHSTIMRRDSWFDSGIMKFEDRWANIYEELHCIFFHKLGRTRRVEEANFYWRDHPLNMSSTLCQWTTNDTYRKIVEPQMRATDYSVDKQHRDVDSIYAELAGELDLIRSKY